MDSVQGGTYAEVASVISGKQKLLEEIGRGASSTRESDSACSASPFSHAPAGDAPHRSGVGYRDRVSIDHRVPIARCVFV